MIVRLRHWTGTWGSLRVPAAGDVHLWCATVTCAAIPSGEWGALLNPEERAKAERFQTFEKRLEFVHGRGLLRTLLAGYLDCHPSEVNIRTTAAGKPFLESSWAPIEFNLSHARGLVLLAFASQRAVGVDVEAATVLPDSDALAGVALSDRERVEYTQLPQNQRSRAFLRCWVAKEASLKACGHGLGTDPRRVEVPVPPPSLSTACIMSDWAAGRAVYHVLSFVPRAGYLASLAWPPLPTDEPAPCLIGFDALDPL